MKALILYVGMVVIGAIIASVIGVYVEKQFGSTVGLVTFLAMFFANFAMSWIFTILIMDGSLRQRPSAS
jgi:hypothetical protein